MKHEFNDVPWTTTGVEMTDSKHTKFEFASMDTLKRVLNPKPRGNIVELNNIDIETLTEREALMLRVINDIEEKLDAANGVSQ